MRSHRTSRDDHRQRGAHVRWCEPPDQPRSEPLAHGHALGNDTAGIVLTMLARDRDFSLRNVAAYFIGHRVAASQSRALDAAAWEFARSGGTILALNLLNGHQPDKLCRIVF